MNCCDCAHKPRAIGSRCGACYVRRHAVVHSLMSQPYFRLNFDPFVSALVGRFWSIEAGLTPEDESVLVKIAFRNKKGKPPGPSRVEALMAIIRAADKLAMKQRRLSHAADGHRSEEAGN